MLRACCKSAYLRFFFPQNSGFWKVTSRGAGISQPARERWMAQKERKWMENKNPKYKNLEKLKMCKNNSRIQMCRYVDVCVSIDPCIFYTYTSQKMILANSTNSGPGYKMPRTWLSHVETFNSFMLRFLCHCFNWNLVPNLLFTGFAFCVYWQYIYFKECSPKQFVPQHEQPQDFGIVTSWASLCHPLHDKHLSNILYQSFKLRPISCSPSDVICKEQSVPFVFQCIFVQFRSIFMFFPLFHSELS